MGDRWDRERWRTAAERLLATDMGVDEWCALNHVSSSALYRRLAWFRDNEPEVLGGWEAAHAGDGERRWLEAVRAAARGAALPSAPHAPGFVEVGHPAPAPGPLPGDRRHGGVSPHHRGGPRHGGERAAGRIARRRAGRALGGGVGVNPFAAPQRVFVSASPCDMRAGILTLAERVSSQLGRDPSDGSLYCFVSRDCRKCKMVRFDDGAWCMWC